MSASNSARIIVRSSRSGRMRTPTRAKGRGTVRRGIPRVCHDMMAVINEIRRCQQLCVRFDADPMNCWGTRCRLSVRQTRIREGRTARLAVTVFDDMGDELEPFRLENGGVAFEVGDHRAPWPVLPKLSTASSMNMTTSCRGAAPHAGHRLASREASFISLSPLAGRYNSPGSMISACQRR